MMGTMVTDMAIDTASPDLGMPNADDQQGVDEQAGQDLGQRRHGLDDGADRLRARPPTSVMYTAVPIPSGTEMTTAIPTSITVPTMAWRIPPWVQRGRRATPAMSWVIEARVDDGLPPLDERVDDGGAQRESRPPRPRYNVAATNRSTTMSGGCATATRPP